MKNKYHFVSEKNHEKKSMKNEHYLLTKSRHMGSTLICHEINDISIKNETSRLISAGIYQKHVHHVYDGRKSKAISEHCDIYMLTFCSKNNSVKTSVHQQQLSCPYYFL